MRVVLIYPPPWKIPDPGQPVDRVDGPPPDYQDGDLDPDFWQIPYGLLSLAAQLDRAGYPVKVLNLSAYPFSQVEQIISTLKADLYGMSCWTANRRGVALVARLIKEQHPESHVVVGGPHATPLAREMLEHHPQIDTVAVGESEAQLLELADRLRTGGGTLGIPGTWFRAESGPQKAAARPAIADLDELVSPHDLFDTHIVMTSRGCPWACTFCGAESSWGRGYRAQSVDYVLDALEKAVTRVPVKMLQIKDDTFTTSKKRVIELCRGIRERKINFLWSCDTRVDVLSDELLREMRLAGCERLSLGVESGSAKILKAIDKKITVEKIVQSTELARKYGIKVRYFMMLGNRGETAETFQETLRFLDRARPNQYIFSCLSIYPGTIDYKDAEAAGLIDTGAFFRGKFQEFKAPFDASPEDTELFSDWFSKNHGLQEQHQQDVAECQSVLAELGDHHAAYLDLAGACYRAGDWAQAEHSAQRALELGLPTPGLAHNLLACVAAQQKDLDGLQTHLRRALREDPQHFVVARNAEALRRWFVEDGPTQNLPLELSADHEFRVFERTRQPTLPGPLEEGALDWAGQVFVAPSPDASDSSSAAQARTRLRVVSSP